MDNPRSRGRAVRPRPVPSRAVAVFYWIIGIIGVLGTLLIIIYTAGGTPPALPPPEMGSVEQGQGTASPNLVTEQPAPPIPEGKTEDGFYFKGDPQAPVKVIEYSDFECPACAYFHHHPISKVLHEEYLAKGKVQLIFHDYPLQMHPHAVQAAEAARCAGDQNKFWAYHDILYQQQSVWTSRASLEEFARMATQVGVEREAFVACMNNQTHRDYVKAAAEASFQSGVRATPMFRVDGGSPISSGDLLPAIRAALEAKGL